MLAVALACSVALAGDAGSARALAVSGVQRAAEAMERATLRADSGAYMALVDTTDAVFAEEQRKWARDLRTHPVATVSVTVDTDALAPSGSQPEAWTAPITLTWTLPGDDETRSVTYPAAFRPLGMPEGAWLFSGRVWESYPAEGVRILLDPGDDDAHDIAEHLSTRVATFRASVESDLGERLPADPTIKIYPGMEPLQESIALSYTDTLGGWNEPGESIKILSRDGFVGPRLDATVAHEIGHAVSFEWGPAIIDAPWWSLEGIAEVAADPFRKEPRTTARTGGVLELLKEGRLQPFARLADFRGEAMNHGRQVYVQGHSMVRYIEARFGRDARNAWFRAMGGGASVGRATQDVLGLPFDRLEGDWRTMLDEGEPAPDAPAD